MRSFAMAFLVCGALTLSVAAQNNCVSWKCFNPPPYMCPYCDWTNYNGASACTTVESYDSSNRTFCILSGSCDTGMGDECFPSSNGVACGPDQKWTRWLNPKPLNEEFVLVSVKSTSHAPKRPKA